MIPWKPPSYCAVVNHSVSLDESEVAWWVEAVNSQIRDYCAPLWNAIPMTVAFHGSAPSVPPDQACVLGIVDEDDDVTSAGYHTLTGDVVWGIVDLSQSRPASAVLSHEALEMFGNPSLNRTVPGPNDLLYYVELADAVQENTYEMPVTLFGETRQVTLSDFLLPAWFEMNPVTSDGYSFRKQITGPWHIDVGGYQIAETADQDIVYLSRGEHRAGRLALNRTSRLRTRHH